MKLKSIPNSDVRARVRRRLIKETAICVGIAAILVALLVATKSFTPIYIIFITILCVFPIIVLKYWNWFTDRTFEGEVVEVKHKQFVDDLYQHISLRTPNGKIKKATVKRTFDDLTPIYAVGDYVRHYYGTKYMQKVGAPTNICVFCGTRSRHEAERCSVCGAGLIDCTK